MVCKDTYSVTDVLAFETCQEPYPWHWATVRGSKCLWGWGSVPTQGCAELCHLHRLDCHLHRAGCQVGVSPLYKNVRGTQEKLQNSPMKGSFKETLSLNLFLLWAEGWTREGPSQQKEFYCFVREISANFTLALVYKVVHELLML